MATDVGIKIGVEGEKGFKDALSGINSQIRSLNSELKSVSEQFDGMEQSEEAVSARTDVLNRTIDANKQKLSILTQQYENSKKKLEDLNKQLEKAKSQYGENSAEALKLQNSYNRQVRSVNDLNRQITDTNSTINRFTRELKNVENAANDVSEELDDVSEATSGFSDAFSGAFLGGAISGAIQSLIGSVGSLVEETLEYRKILGTLEVSSQKAGYTAEQTAQTYEQLYSVLGDDQTAATATANLQALGLSQEQLTQITDGAIGAWATYGDSIPIDGLAEAINETIKAGAVTGTFADVLNWAGTSEDDFNAKLEKMKDPAQRVNLVLQELANQGLIQAAEGWRQNNEDIVALNQATNDLNGTMADFSELITPLVVTVKEGFNQILESVLGIINAFSEGGMEKGISEIQNVFTNMFNGLQEVIPQVLTNIQTLMPQIISTITNAFFQLGTYLQENLPSLISTGLTFLEGFSASLRENAGILISSGLELIKNIADGIISSLPVLIEKVPTIITNIAGIINDNAPKIIATGLEIIVNLVKGIINAIPVIIQNLPKIIEAIVSIIMAFNWINLGKNIIDLFKKGIETMFNAVKGAASKINSSIWDTVKTLPSKLLELGRSLMNNLISGIKGLISSLGSNIKTVFNTIVDGIKSLPAKMLEIGRDVLQGLIDGLLGGIAGIGSAVKTVAESVINKFKSIFDIHSPSKVMEDEVGLMVGKGIGKGIEKSESYIAGTAKKILGVVSDEISDLNKKITDMEEKEAKEQAEEELKAYKKSLEDKYAELEKAELEEREKIRKEIASIEAEWDKKQTEKAKTAEKEQLEARLSALNEFKENYETAIEDIKEKYKESYQDIEEQQKSMTDKLKDYGELFTVAEGEDGELFELGDIQSDIDKIREYGNALQELKDKGISDSLMLEIQELDVDEALGYTKELLKMSDEEFANYMELWNEKQKEAQAVASKFYEDEFKTLDKEFVSKVPEELDGLKDDMKTLGINSAMGLTQGFLSEYENIKNSFVSTISNALQAAKDEMGVHSPSTVWADFGVDMADGLDVGFVNRMKKVTQDISNSLPRGVDSATNSSVMRAAEATVNGMSLNSISPTQPIIVKMVLDGREIAQSIFDPLKDVSKQRGVSLG